MLKRELRNSATFMPDAEGIWRCIVTYTEYVHIGDILAHICEQYDINIHDYLQLLATTSLIYKLRFACKHCVFV